jgi:hypothetical protein
MAVSLDQTQERIDAAQTALADSTKLYDDGKLQYEKATALYNQAKAYYDQAKNFANALNNPSFSPLEALAVASTYAEDVQTFKNDIISNQNNAGELLKQQKVDSDKKLKVANKALKKAEKEVQKTEKYLKGVEKQIDNIKQQLNIATQKSLKQTAEEEKAISDAKVTRNRAKITTNGVKAKLRKNRSIIVALAKAAIMYAVGYLLNNYLTSLASTVQNLTALVDKTNDILVSAKTKQDILKAKVARDAAIAELNKAFSEIAIIRNYLQLLQDLLTVFSLVLSVILLIPFPITAKISEQITKAVLTLDALLIMVAIMNAALSSILDEIGALEARLLPLNDLIDQAINNNLTPGDINTLLNKSKLGLLEGTIYRGFTFGIFEENDPKFVVAGNKRRYAVAYDRSGFIVLQSKPSFTLDPYVLVEELKLIIDEQNLEP